MARNHLSILLFAAALLLAAAPARADYIDLLDSAWSPANNQASHTVIDVLPGLNLTITAGGGSGRLWWDGAEGFGVRGGLNSDEIDYGEVLSLTFSQPVTLNSFKLFDLFKERWGHGSYYREKGYAVLDGAATVHFQADSGQIYPGWDLPGDGVLVVGVGTGPVTQIQFYADYSSNLFKRNNDYQVGGLDVTPSGSGVVPEPASLLLTASALGLGAWLRRRRA